MRGEKHSEYEYSVEMKERRSVGGGKKEKETERGRKEAGGREEGEGRQLYDTGANVACPIANASTNGATVYFCVFPNRASSTCTRNLAASYAAKAFWQYSYAAKQAIVRNFIFISNISHPPPLSLRQYLRKKPRLRRQARGCRTSISAIALFWVSVSHDRT